MIAVGAYGEGFIRRLATVGIWDRLILARIDPSGLALVAIFGGQHLRHLPSLADNIRMKSVRAYR